MKPALLKIAAAAAGITLALCIAAGSVLWYVSRPNPPKPWNEKALIADVPAFDFYGEEDRKDLTISLGYQVQNTTDSDYSINTPQQVKVLARYGNGIWSEPIDSDKAEVHMPVFIPAHHVGTIILHLKAFHAPKRSQSESKEAYRERLRQSMNQQMGNIRGFVLFDDMNRYEVHLQQWASTKPEKNDRELH